MPCRLFPSQSLHYHVQLDGGTAQLILLHCFPLFFIFYWIKHDLFPLASGLQVLIEVNDFSHKFVGNWGLGQKLSSLQYLSASNSHFDTQKEGSSAVIWSVALLDPLACNGRLIISARTVHLITGAISSENVSIYTDIMTCFKRSSDSSWLPVGEESQHSAISPSRYKTKQSTCCSVEQNKLVN